MRERKNVSYPVVPFDRSYWVVPGRFLAGCYPGDLDVVPRQWRDALARKQEIEALFERFVDETMSG
jgi:hypothetical protein